MFYYMTKEHFDQLKEGFNTNLSLKGTIPTKESYKDGFFLVAPIYRSATTNKVVLRPLKEKADKLFSAIPVTCNTDNEPITYSCINTVADYTRKVFSLSESNTLALAESQLRTIGVLKMNGLAILLVNIIIKDEYISLLEDTCKNLLIAHDIKDLSKYPNLSQFDKMVLSTIVETN